MKIEDIFEINVYVFIPNLLGKVVAPEVPNKIGRIVKIHPFGLELQIYNARYNRIFNDKFVSYFEVIKNKKLLDLCFN